MDEGWAVTQMAMLSSPQQRQSQPPHCLSARWLVDTLVISALGLLCTLKGSLEWKLGPGEEGRPPSPAPPHGQLPLTSWRTRPEPGLSQVCPR